MDNSHQDSSNGYNFLKKVQKIGLSFFFLVSTPKIMANTTNLNIIFEAISLIPKIHNVEKYEKKAKTICQKTEEIQENSPTKTTRRLALGLATTIALFANSRIGNSLAQENNGFFITGPLQVPSVSSSKPFLKFSTQFFRISIPGNILSTSMR